MRGDSILRIRNIALFLIALALTCPLGPVLLRNARPMAATFFRSIYGVCLDWKTRDMLSIENNNFILKYTDADRDTAEFVLQAMEEYYGLVGDLLDYKPSGAHKTRVVLYPDRKSLNSSFGWSGEKSADGVYWAGSIRLLSPHALAGEDVSPAVTEERYKRVAPLSHELTHLLVDSMTRGNYTRWLTEGLAQYAEEGLTGFILQEPDSEAKKRLYTLEELDKNFDEQPDQALAYWQSLETVGLLIRSHGLDKMRELLTSLGQGEALSAAFSKTYGFSLEALQTKVQQRALLSINT